MAKVVIPVGLDTNEVKKNTKSVRDMLGSLGSASKSAGDQLGRALERGSASTAKLITDLQRANLEVAKQEKEVARLKMRLEELRGGDALVKTPETSALAKEMDDANKSAEKVAQQMDKLALEAERLEQTRITIGGDTVVSDPQKYAETVAELDRLGEEYQKLTEKADNAKKKLRGVTENALQNEISMTNQKLEETSAKLNSAKAKALSAGNALKEGSRQGQSGLDKFNARIAGLVKRVFVFSVITQALRSLKKLFMQSAQGSAAFKGAVASLQQSLWGLYSVLYQYIMPVVIRVIQLISRLAQNILTLFSRILGKSTSQLIANGKALQKQSQGLKKTGKAAKDAGGQVASFDELNKLGGEDESQSNAGESGEMSFPATELSKGVEGVLDAILLVAGGALFVIGLLLVCTGISIGTGIGLMLAGIAILAAEIVSVDWNALPENIRNTLTIIAGIAGVALLAIGIILVCCGNLAIGIPCMLAGVALLVGAAALNKNAIIEFVKKNLTTILTIVGGAFLALGVVLLALGNVPFGIALIVAGVGALGVVAAKIVDFKGDSIRKTLTIIAMIAAGAMLALGIILVACGVSLPLGIGLIVAGAALLVSQVLLNSNLISDDVKRVISIIMGIVGGALVVLGIILLCCGQIPLGLSLLAAGAISLVTVIAANKDAIVNWIKGVWNSILSFWNRYIAPIFTKEWWLKLAKRCGDGLLSGVKAAINGVIWLANKWIDGLNFLLIPVRAIIYGVAKAFGSSIKFHNVKLPHIPALATGAVLPANKPFLAMLGDQKNGTNIEAPLSTIEQAVRNVVGEGVGGDLTVQLVIDGTAFGKAVVKSYDSEKRRVGASFVSRKVVFG